MFFKTSWQTVDWSPREWGWRHAAKAVNADTGHLPHPFTILWTSLSWPKMTLLNWDTNHDAVLTSLPPQPICFRHPVVSFCLIFRGFVLFSDLGPYWVKRLRICISLELGMWELCRRAMKISERGCAGVSETAIPSHPSPNMEKQISLKKKKKCTW